MKQNCSSIVIFKREIKAYFTSPIAYIVTGLFLLASGFLFFNTFFLNNRAELRQFFGLLPIVLSFFIPALTMRLLAEFRCWCYNASSDPFLCDYMLYLWKA